MEKKVVEKRFSKTGSSENIQEMYEREKALRFSKETEYVSLVSRLEVMKKLVKSEKYEKKFLASEKLAITKKSDSKS